jgi:hypothetical protein
MDMLHLSRVALVGLSLALAPAAVLGHGDEAHGNHDSHHGGFVAMYKDVHCEIVVQPQGTVQVFYTDAMRKDLPASIASDVTVEIEGADRKTESVPMAVSRGGDFWEGKAKPVADGKLHLAFLLQGEPVVMHLPIASLKAKPVKAAAPAAAPAKPADHSAHQHDK